MNNDFQYYPLDTTIDINKEIHDLSLEKKTNENIGRLENLKKIRTIRNWFNKWFLNDARKDVTQFVYHSNYVFYWSSKPETVVVDTIFVNVYPNKKIEVKKYLAQLFLIEHAECHYEEVTGRNTLLKLEKIMNSNQKITIIDKLIK